MQSSFQFILSNNGTESIRALIFYDLRHYSIFGKQIEHYRSIFISLLISYAIINNPAGAMDMVLASGARGPRSSLARSTLFFRQEFLMKYRIKNCLICTYIDICYRNFVKNFLNIKFKTLFTLVP